mgnify:FL=1
MFEICETMLVQLVNCLPVLLGCVLLFDLLGGLLFGKGK